METKGIGNFIKNSGGRVEISNGIITTYNKNGNTISNTLESTPVHKLPVWYNKKIIKAIKAIFTNL